VNLNEKVRLEQELVKLPKLIAVIGYGADRAKRSFCDRWPAVGFWH